MAQDLLQRLLCKDPKKRLGAGPQGAQEVKNHPFFQVRLLSRPRASLHIPKPGCCSGLGDMEGMVSGWPILLDLGKSPDKECRFIFSFISIETWKMCSLGKRILGSSTLRAGRDLRLDLSVLSLDRFGEGR